MEAPDADSRDHATKAPGGLGRDLAAILDRSTPEVLPEAGGLQLLMGRQSNAARTPPRVRRFVAEVAIDAIADAFGADAVVLARCTDSDEAPELSSRFPPSWDDSSGMRFELFGHLWRIFDSVRMEADRGCDSEGRSDGREIGWETIRVGDHHLWLGSHRRDDLYLAAGVVFARPLPESEQRALARVLGSVAGAMRPQSAKSGSSFALSVVSPPGGAPVSGTEGDVEVQVTSDDGHTVRSARGRGSSEDMAVAQATLALAECSPANSARPESTARVMFAGRTNVDRLTVSIVVLSDAESSPRLGLAVSNGDGRTGPGEAVLSALGT